MKVLSIYKKINLDYKIEKKYDAGIVLKGWEVKTLKNNSVNLEGCFVYEKNSEMFLKGLNIRPWRYTAHVPKFMESIDRKLLLHKAEILNLKIKMKEKRFTIVPVELYEIESKIKLTIALVTGNKKYDKRQRLKEKDLKKILRED